MREKPSEKLVLSFSSIQNKHISKGGLGLVLGVQISAIWIKKRCEAKYFPRKCSISFFELERELQ